MQSFLAWIGRHWAVAVAVLLVACGVLGYVFAAPPPPRVIRLAVGTDPESAYTQAIEAYARRLTATGFRVQRRATQGSVENLRLLENGQIDIAIVQGGIADPVRDSHEESLGAIFAEPVWIFLRAEQGLERPAGLRGRRVAVGPEGSGTRAVAFDLLRTNDLEPEDVIATPEAGEDAAMALLEGRVDAAFFVAATPTRAIRRLMEAEPEVTLVDFGDRAAAYGIALPFLSPVTLPRSGLSIAADLPSREVTLMAPVASVIVRQDTHPQVVSLLVGIMQEVHRPRSLFSPEGTFPNTLAQELPLNADAQRYYERGRTVLQSWLPFWVAVWVERLFVILLPILGIALPLIRFGPALYRWQTEHRVWRHYETLRRIETEATLHRDEPERMDTLREQLEVLDARVARLVLPPSYRRHLFALRRDIAYVRDELAEGGVQPA